MDQTSTYFCSCEIKASILYLQTYDIIYQILDIVNYLCVNMFKHRTPPFPIPMIIFEANSK